MQFLQTNSCGQFRAHWQGLTLSQDWKNACPKQGLSQDLQTGCLKLAVVKSLGVQIFKGDHIYSYFNHKHV